MFLSVVAALFQLGMGNAQGWAISSKRIFKNKIKAARLIKKRMDLLCAITKFGAYKLQSKLILKLELDLQNF